MVYPRLGAIVNGSKTTFRVFAPAAGQIEVVFSDGRLPERLRREDLGYHSGELQDAPSGTAYRLRMDGGPALPDPASRYQPEGVHGPSVVVDPHSFAWSDSVWRGIPQEEIVFYELHVGTFTREGTFDGVSNRLEYLKELGITAIELMPVADFPGDRNWGYDSAALYAPSRAYGVPDDLRRLVDEAHRIGLAVFLDVVYNHLGPDGAYAAAFAPMFTERHQTPWGRAINLDDEGSPGVRGLFIDNALYWLREFHLDGLRLDATHSLIDQSATHFLAELSAAVKGLDGHRRYLVAEDPRNINTIVRARANGGYGIDAVWTDDFHHQVRAITAGDSESYYADYVGSTLADVASTLGRGWYFDGRLSPSTGKPRGTDPSEIRLSQCVICIQNHDQVGNRPLGNRLTSDIDLPTYRALTAILLFAPELPLLFMGQEWAASTPFQFFTDHNPELGRLVTEGRRKEFASFSGFKGSIPDPQEISTFESSRLRWQELEQAPHSHTLNLYRDLLRFRRELALPTYIAMIGELSIWMARGRLRLLSTLGDGEELELPEDVSSVLDTEQPEYAAETRAIEIRTRRVRFQRPGAVLGLVTPGP